MKSLRLVAIAAEISAVAGTAFADDAVVKDGYAFDQNKLIPTGVRAEVGTTVMVALCCGQLTHMWV